ncbi:PAS domain S-box protein [Ferruginibacter lapsinanis]|uniref:PAS domain S-box protein n=1 Tax=Ferruginibacter lapsinanis TaxID=563172 RepID=UPI001E49FFB4|nr:PAS domain S-box protein [Ferruginibacter lapsinanis]UEG48884.1 PAS domain S-box protein [Ferruginibacter lapsinanis]
MHSAGENFYKKNYSENLEAVSGNTDFMTNCNKFESADSTVQMNKQREYKDSNLYALINNTKDLMWSVDRNYQVITFNQAFIETIIKMYPQSLDIEGNITANGIGEGMVNKYKKYFDRAFSGEIFTEIEYTTTPVEHWSEISFYPIQEGKNIIGTACHAHDITHRKKAASRILYINRIYAFLSQINQTIVRSENEQMIYKEVCRIAAEIGEFKAAWIGMFNKGDQTINYIEGYGLNVAEIDQLTNAVYDDNGPQQQVLLMQRYCVCNDLQHELSSISQKFYMPAESFGSMIVLPIKKSGDVIGTINLYASEKNFFTAREIALLEEAANDISFALDVFEKDRLRTIAEGRLKKSELHLNEAQAIAHLGSWELDIASGIAIWSAEALAIYGIPPEENAQPADSWLTFIHPDDLDAVIKINEEAKRTSSDMSFFYRILQKKGTIKYLYSRTKFQFDSDGNVTGLRGVFQDVTEMKATEKALAQAEETQTELLAFNQQLIDISPIGIASYDAVKGKCVSANAAFANIVGTSVRRILSQNFRQISSWKESGLLKAAEATLENGEIHSDEINLITSFDKNVWVVYKFIKFINKGRPHLLLLVHDVTKRKTAERSLMQSELRYRQIVETANEGIWMIDEYSKTIFVNKKMNEIFEYSEAEMLGKDIFYFMDEAGKQLAKESIKRRKEGIGDNYEFSYITKTGRPICTRISANPIFDDNGKYKGALAMVDDITEKKILEQQLLKQKLAEQKKIAKAVISAQEKERTEIGVELHDNVNQLLAASKLYLNHSLTQEAYQPFVTKSIEYLGTAMTELRKLSHALVGPAQNEAIGLNLSLEELIQSIKAVKNIEINLNSVTFKENESEPALKLVIYRIIQEQLSNILKHAEATRVKIEIESKEEGLIVLISDNGKGFDVSAKREGIGLKNIKHRAGLYNGTVNIVSSPGNGCDMKIAFINN